MLYLREHMRRDVFEAMDLFISWAARVQGEDFCDRTLTPRSYPGSGTLETSAVRPRQAHQWFFIFRDRPAIKAIVTRKVHRGQKPLHSPFRSHWSPRGRQLGELHRRHEDTRIAIVRRILEDRRNPIVLSKTANSPGAASVLVGDGNPP